MLILACLFCSLATLTPELIKLDMSNSFRAIRKFGPWIEFAPLAMLGI
ncbi:MAG: hypothetical protein ACI87E_004936 [Mariniblastus sp.]|jgi:hypothetical protein